MTTYAIYLIAASFKKEIDFTRRAFTMPLQYILRKTRASFMKFQALEIPEVKLITPAQFNDERGFFMETFRQDVFEQEIGYPVHFVQDNHSLSTHIYTVRGLHFQTPPCAQGKLVRCIHGSVLDVAVDARLGSKTYGRHVKAVLSANNAAQLWVPEGFLHGFATLEPDSEIVYKCTNRYDQPCDGAIARTDPNLAIDWGFPTHKAVLSQKDADAPHFCDFLSPFSFD
jgi:dTDP-4-dehydrorhamnose 3,5-epimerase